MSIIRYITKNKLKRITIKTIDKEFLFAWIIANCNNLNIDKIIDITVKK